MSGKACVVTGASSGLGRESARALAAAGAHVILAARNRAALAEAAHWITAQVPDAQTSTVELDLTALSSVRAAAQAIGDVTPVVDVLMNNAGVMFTPFGRTRDGFELQIGTNHFGHFALTRLLIPQLAAAGGARLVILSSAGHVMGDVDFDDPNWERRPARSRHARTGRGHWRVGRGQPGSGRSRCALPRGLRDQPRRRPVRV